MDFSHYTDQPVDLAVDLVNTVQLDGDHLSQPEDLERFLNEHRELWEGAASPAEAGDLEQIRRLRESLRAVITAEDEESATQNVNAILDEYGAAPRVSLHNGQPHLHFEPMCAEMPSFLGTTTAMGLATVIVEHGVDRFGVCSSSDCEDVYVDTSRNRSRLHCSNTCSTREAVAAYRKRQTN
ncbi:MAG: ABATE domain-containing protein [Acidimicrobiia bacterium]